MQEKKHLAWRLTSIPALLGTFLAGGVIVLSGSCRPALAVPPGSGVAIAVPAGVRGLELGACGMAGVVIVTNQKGQKFRLAKKGGTPKLFPLEDCPPPAREETPGRLHDGLIAHGSLTIKRAWLAGPTRRYRHGILGDAVEAEQLRVITDDGRDLTFSLGAESVFEDLFPRVMDIEGDGQEEILLVRSRIGRGSSAALFGIVGGKLQIVAESEPFGMANRWLNPVGMADFDGDQRREIAVVATPHIGGTLILYEKKGSRLVKDHSQFGFSNHAIGSRVLGMSAILDYNGDQIPDLAVPGRTRKILRVVTFAGGRFRELRRFDYGQEIVTAILKANFGTQIRPDLVFGLQDGTLVVLPR